MFAVILLRNKEIPGGKIGLAGQVHAETPQTGLVSRCGHVRNVDFAVAEVLELFKGQLRRRIRRGADAERDEGFFEIEADGFLIQDIRLHATD